MTPNLTQTDVERIASETANKTVEKLFLTMGIDVTEPAAVLQMQADFRHLRDWRESIGIVKRYGIRAAVSVIVSGLLGLVALYFRGKI